MNIKSLLQFSPNENVEDILLLIDSLKNEEGKSPNRETSLAITKLEEAILWLLVAPKSNE